tara:strand:+ start:3805 stop:4050 length:246 start_codon:yes stop_codon:yes gene_type:complete
MQKLYKINKANLDNMIVNEYKDLNLIALQVRSLKMQIESLNELIDAMGINSFGTSHKQIKLKDYQLDDNDNFIVKTEERTY